MATNRNNVSLIDISTHSIFLTLGSLIYLDRENVLHLRNFSSFGIKSNGSGALIYSYNQNEISLEKVTNAGLESSFGAVIYSIEGDSINLKESVFRDNSASFSGGVLYVQSKSTARIENCTFFNNTAQLYGGVLFAALEAVVFVENSVFTINKVFILNGAVFKLFSLINLEMQYCQFVSNQAQLEGGLVQVTSDSILSVSYCVISLVSKSISFQYGGLLHGDSSNNISLQNVYIYGEVYSEIEGSLVYLGDLNLFKLDFVYLLFKVLKLKTSDQLPSLLYFYRENVVTIQNVKFDNFQNITALLKLSSLSRLIFYRVYLRGNSLSGSLIIFQGAGSNFICSKSKIYENIAESMIMISHESSATFTQVELRVCANINLITGLDTNLYFFHGFITVNSNSSFCSREVLKKPLIFLSGKSHISMRKIRFGPFSSPVLDPLISASRGITVFFRANSFFFNRNLNSLAGVFYLQKDVSALSDKSKSEITLIGNVFIGNHASSCAVGLIEGDFKLRITKNIFCANRAIGPSVQETSLTNKAKINSSSESPLLPQLLKIKLNVGKGGIFCFDHKGSKPNGK